MQSQDTATFYFFKAWSWAENNAKRIAVGAGITAITVALICYYFWQQNQTEITAGETLTQLVVSTSPNSDPSQLAAGYLKIAADYPGSRAGERALLLGAAALFTNGQYAQAQAQFQKYLDTQPGGAYSAQAALGVATSLDAQGKTDPAVMAYQRVISAFPDANAVDAAKFALAKIDEQRGKLIDAEKFYQDVARDNPNNLLGSEAAFRAMQLRAKSPMTTPPGTSPTSFNLSTKP
ncbi:MAG TPA: tetratricopeptide repeat protein [Verrucomicrobiae bacterium]|nr:tetratricopeptide repeat protein [Verrucomicrobiae bacterium]